VDIEKAPFEERRQTGYELSRFATYAENSEAGGSSERRHESI